jgi:hypothetical protein
MRRRKLRRIKASRLWFAVKTHCVVRMARQAREAWVVLLEVVCLFLVIVSAACLIVGVRLLAPARTPNGGDRVSGVFFVVFGAGLAAIAMIVVADAMRLAEASHFPIRLREIQPRPAAVEATVASPARTAADRAP